MPRPPNTNTGLWDFACWLYQQHDIKDLCLDLQNHNHADINLILFCCWHGNRRGLINETLWPALLATSQHWQHDILQPLRMARHALKQKPALYQQTLALELSCEKAQLQTLEGLALQNNKTQNACNLNLRHYLVNLLGVDESKASITIEKLTHPLT